MFAVVSAAYRMWLCRFALNFSLDNVGKPKTKFTNDLVRVWGKRTPGKARSRPAAGRSTRTKVVGPDSVRIWG